MVSCLKKTFLMLTKLPKLNIVRSQIMFFLLFEKLEQVKISFPERCLVLLETHFSILTPLFLQTDYPVISRTRKEAFRVLFLMREKNKTQPVVKRRSGGRTDWRGPGGAQRGRSVQRGSARCHLCVCVRVCVCAWVRVGAG